MVCSQVYSQRPSRCVLSAAHQGRSWGLSNAEMRFLEVETGEGDCKEISACCGNSRPSNGYACSKYASVLSPIKSSWIQRLRASQLTKSLPTEREGFDGLQADWSHDAVLNSRNGTQSGFAIYENSRRSVQDFSSKHEILLVNSTCSEHIGVNVPPTSRICKPLEALQPKIQVPPRTLPVVECLLNPGCTKNSLDPHVSMETNRPHNLFRSGFLHPIKQTVHFSADERSRVSCSSIGGLNHRSGRRAAEDLNASLMGEKRFNASQSTLEFSFNCPRANMDSTYGGRKPQNCTYLGMDFTNGPQIEDQIGSNCSESRDPVSVMGSPCMERRYRTDESRSLDMCSMPFKARCIDSFPECFMQANQSTARTEGGLHADQKSMQTMSKRNIGHLQEQQDYGKGAMFAFEVSCGKRGAFSGGGRSNSGLRKDGSQRTSDLVSSQFETNVREKASISLAPCLIEQELGSSQESHKEQDVTSGSFSFYSKSRLPYGSADAKVVAGREHWPFCETTPYIEGFLLQTRLQKDWRTRDLLEASRLEMLPNNVSTTQHEVDNAYFGRSQCSFFSGTEPLTEYGRHRLASGDVIQLHKPTCRGAYTGELKTEGLYKHGVNQNAGVKQEKARQQNDGFHCPRIRSDSVVKGVEGREQKFSHPSRTLRRINWEGFKPPARINTFSVGSTESCLKRPADHGTQGLATNAEARNTITVLEGPVHSFSAGSGLHKAAHAPKSEERGAKGRDGSVSRKKMWLKRWSTTNSREEPALLKSNRERSNVYNRRLTENDYSTSQSSRESSHHFDLRPAKRACYGQRSGLHTGPCQAIPAMGSVAVVGENQQGFGDTSHFMKQFSTPSATAMAIMGMTARKVHATKPERGGLFGVWPVKYSTNKPLTGQSEAGKDILTRHNNRKEFLHSSEKPSCTQFKATQLNV